MLKDYIRTFSAWPYLNTPPILFRTPLLPRNHGKKTLLMSISRAQAAVAEQKLDSSRHLYLEYTSVHPGTWDYSTQLYLIFSESSLKCQVRAE